MTFQGVWSFLLFLDTFCIHGECDEKRDESLSVFPALGKLYFHTPASLFNFCSFVDQPYNQIEKTQLHAEGGLRLT